jgi:chromosome partitioning protein
MTRVLAVANQKGGVAKTTTTQALGVALADLGERVLLVDLDPQACLTYSCGVDPDTLERSLNDVLAGRAEAGEVLAKVGDVHLLPATIDLAGAEVHLMSRTGREQVLARALRPMLADYDTVFIDCPPSLSILTISGLTAATEVLIPLQCNTLGHRGVGQLLETIRDVRSYTNPELRVRGLVATMFDRRTRHAQEVLADLEGRYELPVIGPPIPKSVRFAEAPGRGRSILEHAPSSPGAEAYRVIARLLHEESTG